MSDEQQEHTPESMFLGFVVAVAAAASLAGCAEIEVPSAEPYEPAQLESTGPSSRRRSSSPKRPQHRVALQTTLVRAPGADVTRWTTPPSSMTRRASRGSSRSSGL